MWTIGYGYAKRVIESMWGSQEKLQRLRDIWAGLRKNFVGGAKKGVRQKRGCSRQHVYRQSCEHGGVFSKR